jgi:hypothetical protein
MGLPGARCAGDFQIFKQKFILPDVRVMASCAAFASHVLMGLGFGQVILFMAIKAKILGGFHQ